MGVWIETDDFLDVYGDAAVTPYVGVWIETAMSCLFSFRVLVTPYVGVWIETYKDIILVTDDNVTPYVGVWIETKQSQNSSYKRNRSHPTWVCGLKRTRRAKAAFAA